MVLLHFNIKNRNSYEILLTFCPSIFSNEKLVIIAICKCGSTVFKTFFISLDSPLNVLVPLLWETLGIILTDLKMQNVSLDLI